MLSRPRRRAAAAFAPAFRSAAAFSAVSRPTAALAFLRTLTIAPLPLASRFSLAPALARGRGLVRASRAPLPLGEVRPHLLEVPRGPHAPHAQPPLARDRHAVAHVVEAGRDVGVRVDRGADASRARRPPPPPVQVEPRRVRVDLDAHTPFRRRFDQDRKSTRLNSSHVKISYA